MMKVGDRRQRTEDGWQKMKDKGLSSTFVFSSLPLPTFYEGAEKAFRIQKILLDEKTADLV